MSEQTVETKTVMITACKEHGGYSGNLLVVTLPWICPICGGPRGNVFKGLSYDGSRRLEVDCWENACGHIDYYENVRGEWARIQRSGAEKTDEKTEHPEICPMTGWEQWGQVEHPHEGWLMTYGGPYNTYTIPKLDREGLVFERYNFCQDAGNWSDEAPEYVVDLQELLLTLLKSSALLLPENSSWLRKRIVYVLSEVDRVESKL